MMKNRNSLTVIQLNDSHAHFDLHQEMFRQPHCSGVLRVADDPDSLIAASQVVAIHFQTIAAANNYWRDEH